MSVLLAVERYLTDMERETLSRTALGESAEVVS